MTIKKNIRITISVALLAISTISASKKDSKDVTNNSVQKIDSLYDIDINSCKQKILVQTNDIDNPILLYLHGGPGSSAMPYSHLYAEKLKDNFIFVNWDQRGTGFSYHEGMDTTKISYYQILDDAIEVTKYLINTFHKEKIYLLGHSFGSVVGLKLAELHPEFLYAYIGVGQVIDWDRSVNITYNWLHNKLEEVNDSVGLKRIEKNQFPNIDLIIKYGGHHRLSIDLDSVIKTSPYYYDGYLELLKKGRKFSQYYAGKKEKPKVTSFLNVQEVKIPLYFFVGKNDHVTACAPELVEEFCKIVNAPIKEIIWFNNSAHYINVEEPAKFQNELIKILKGNKSE